MAPAQQGLDAAHLVVLKVYDGLELQEEVTALQGTPQRLDDLHAPIDRLAELLSEASDRAALMLRLIHRRISELQ